jgi:hypothetical protein
MPRRMDPVPDRLISFREIKSLMPLKELTDKTRTLLKDQTFSHFESYLKERLDAEES